MKKLKGSIAAKTAAIFLLAVFAIAFVGSVICVGVMADALVYAGGSNEMRERVLSSSGMTEIYKSYNRMCDGYSPAYTQYRSSNGDKAFRFILRDADSGKLLFDGLDGADYQWHAQETLNVPNLNLSDTDYVYWDDNGGIGQPENTTSVILEGYILKEIAEGESSQIFMKLKVAEFMYENRYTFIVVAAVSLILCIVLFVFLMCAAGHRAGREEVVPSFIDKIPFDLFTALIITAVACLWAIMAESAFSEVTAIVFGSLIVLMMALLLLLYIMSFAVRVKTGGLIKGCIIYKIIAWVWEIVKKLWRFAADIIKNLPLVPKTIAVVAALLVLELIALDGGGFMWFLVNGLLAAALIYTAICMKKLLLAGQKLADGDESCTVDTKHMYGPFKTYGEQLNTIRDGVSKAVEARMRSEHFRTELITNVSHDIKTPLTSIINYVDLLGKEKPENEKMREYIDVLQRQSARLKKLIDDLLEASKASTGNLNVNAEPCDVGVLLDQTLGEYGEKLNAAGLEPVLIKPEKPVIIMADGRHMWRIFDNLLNNICKYSMRGTRVYLEVSEQNGKAVVTFRNISSSQLNISSDELMERFVRGDSSRNTEGSGLGLNIAQSLAKLQNGELDLTIDGDLFKITLSFDEMN